MPRLFRLTVAILLFGWFGLIVRAQVGGLDVSFNAGEILNGTEPGVVRAHLMSGGKHIIAGDFTSIGGVGRGNLARLNADGTLDQTFANGPGANGPIHALAFDPSGQLVIGGEFTTYDGVARGRIARLSTTGTLDLTFNPGTGCNGPVLCIEPGAFSLFIGGEFTTVNGATRNRLAELTTTGTLGNLTFNGGTNATVRAMRIDPRSFLHVGGDFTQAGGLARAYHAQFYVFSGSLSGSDLGFNNTVRTIDVLVPSSSSLDSIMLMGGDFTRVGPSPRGRLAAFRIGFTSFPTLDPSFDFWLDAPCRKILTVSTNRVLIAGDFFNLNGWERTRLAALSFFPNSNQGGSSVAAYWSLTSNYGEAGPDDSIYTLGIDGDGKVILGGEFTGFPLTTRSGLLRLYGDAGSQPPATPATLSATSLSDSQIALAWGSSAFASSYVLERSPTGVADWVTIYTGAANSFTDGHLPASGQRFYRVLASNSNGASAFTDPVSTTTAAVAWTGAGSLHPTFPPGSVNGAVAAILRQPDGKIVIAGSFTQVLGSARKYIARLLPDLTLDTSFDPGVSANSPINHIEPAPNGGVYIFGYFSTVGGSTRHDIARLTASGALDTTFNTNAEWTFARGIRSQPDGRLIVFGSFQAFFGAPRNYITRLNLDGSVDVSFDCVSKGTVDTVSLQNDGKILVSSFFGQINGVADKYFTRVEAGGAIDPLFVGSNTTSNITSLVTLPTGAHFAAGSFTTLSGVSRRYLARFNPDGSVDTSFNPGTSTNTSGPLIFPQPGGKVMLAGTFTSFAGTTRWKLARLNENGSLDPTFQAEAGPLQGGINAVLTLPDGSLLVGGSFTSFGTSPRSHLVHLKGDPLESVPATPQNLRGTALSASSITLHWGQIDGEYGWKLERRAPDAEVWQPIADLGWDVTSYTDTGLSTATAYDYRVRAWNGAGDSDYSNTLTARTLNAFETWKIDRGLTVAALDDLDTDGDGMGLFLEYALDLDPTVNDRDGMPLADSFAGLLVMSYPRVRPELVYVVEASTDLQTWSSERVYQGIGSYPTAWIFIGDAPRIFLRLRITQSTTP